MATRLAFRLLVTSLLSPLLVQSQVWTEELRKKLDNVPSSVSIDIENNIYIGFENGSLVKYSETGEEFPVFSFPNRSAISLVEALNNRKIFLFYADIQQISILDRFSAIPKQYLLRDLDVYLAIAACPAPDGTFWITENNPQRLRKIDPLRRLTIHEVQHDLGDSIRFMRTYQNLLLIADENGLQVVDQFGNLTTSLDLKDVKYLQLLGNEVLVTYQGGILKFNPFDSTIDAQLAGPFENVKAVLKLKEKYAVINDNSLTFYNFKEPKQE